MSLSDLGVLIGVLVAFIYPVIESVKTQVKNIKEKKYDKVGLFIMAMSVTVGSAYVLKNSAFIDFEAFKNFNVTDTFILGLYSGLVVTGGKDTINNFKKGKELGTSIQEQFVNLSIEEKKEVTNEMIDLVVSENGYKEDTIETPELEV